MKTWRERIAEARVRKLGWRRLIPRSAFRRRDVDRMVAYKTCLIGETALRLGLDIGDLAVAVARNDGISWMAPLDAIHDDDYRLLDVMLDAIEDRALALKRESATLSPLGQSQ